MSTALANTSGAVRAVPTLTKEQVLEFVTDPLKQLPADWRIPVWDFWAYFEHLLPTQIALCTRLRRWRDFDGLKLGELQRAMDALRGPARAAEFQFASQVMSGLAAQIEADRQADREVERQRRAKEENGTYSAEDFLGAREKWAAIRAPSEAGS